MTPAFGCIAAGILLVEGLILVLWLITKKEDRAKCKHRESINYRRLMTKMVKKGVEMAKYNQHQDPQYLRFLRELDEATGSKK